MVIVVREDYADMSRAAAEVVATALSANPHLVLGLAAGRTPVGLYRELVRRYQAGELDFGRVRTFNLDEYVGLGPDDPRSFRYFIGQHLLGLVNLSPGRADSPNGLAPDLAAECRRYEEAIRAAGGLDLAILGLGHNGHLGFNEPGCPPDAPTSVVRLTPDTRRANAAYFGGVELVPELAISMGLGTILTSRRLLLLASGERKREIVARALEGEISTAVPASLLRRHPDVTVVLDREAAAGLQTP